MAYQKNGKYSPRPKKYTFVSEGTAYSFDPTKTTGYNGKLITLLQLHKDEVKFRNQPDVFILTETGEVLDVTK